MEKEKQWLNVGKRLGRAVVPLVVQIGLTTAVSAGLLSAACAADVNRLLGALLLAS